MSRTKIRCRCQSYLILVCGAVHLLSDNIWSYSNSSWWPAQLATNTIENKYLYLRPSSCKIYFSPSVFKIRFQFPHSLSFTKHSHWPTFCSQISNYNTANELVSVYFCFHCNFVNRICCCCVKHTYIFLFCHYTVRDEGCVSTFNFDFFFVDNLLVMCILKF